MMVMFTTVSVLGSLMVWLGYQTFMVSDNTHPGSAEARSLEEDFSLDQNRRQTKHFQEDPVTSLPPAVLDDGTSKFLEDGGLNKHRTEALEVETTPVVLQDRVGEFLGFARSNPQTQIPKVQNVPSLAPVLLDDFSNVLEEPQNIQQTDNPQLQDVPSLPPDQPHELENNLLYEGRENKLQRGIAPAQNIANLLPLLLDEDIFEERIQEKLEPESPQVEDVPFTLPLPQDDMDEAIEGEKPEDSSANSEQYKVAEARSLFDFIDGSDDHEPGANTGKLEDFNNDVLKDMQFTDDEYIDSTEQDHLFENTHTYEDDHIKAQEKILSFKSKGPKFSLLDILNVPESGGLKFSDANRGNKRLMDSIYVLQSLVNYIENENGLENSALLLDTQTTEEHHDSGISATSDAPKVETNAREGQDGERTLVNDNSIDVESLSDKYMTNLGWEDYAAIVVSVVVLLLLVASILLFVSCYCKNKKTRRRHRESDAFSNKTT